MPIGPVSRCWPTSMPMRMYLLPDRCLTSRFRRSGEGVKSYPLLLRSDSPVNPGACSVEPATTPLDWSALMKLTGSITRSLQADMQAELRDFERAVATGTRDAGPRQSCAGRSAAPGSGSGSPTAGGTSNTRTRSSTRRALVYTKAPQIISAFDEGAMIRSKRGRFLAIPSENAPRKGHRRQADQAEHVPEHRLGLSACPGSS
jgi:hypothetical protein